MGRRSGDDAAWQKLKAQCKIRDQGQCRCCSIMRPYEMKQRSEQNDFNVLMTAPSDVAHCEPVSLHLDKAYDLNNVFFFL